ncbi:Hypothetical predicted protein [Paramuricea clavata]|uniref:Uncharacterized protein n=1 Tax=Paramuricea clavata TaxID=317549 RepID=A0A6S7FSG8_PARCT|nr:Hypothetical predicted protein [Paramuricea clavata]
MPSRKKRTVAKYAKTKREPVLKLPKELGAFDTSLTAEEQESKLNNYIEDYQLQVEGKLDKMRKSIQTAKGLITHCYRGTMIELLKSVKEMTMEEFMSKGGTVDAAINAQVHETITGLATSALGVPTNSRLPLANVSNNIAGLSLDQTSMMSQTSSNVQTAEKSTTRKRKIKAESKPPPTGTRSSRRLQAKSSITNNEVTPMPNMNTLSVLNHSHGMFITPKFDPRLPVPDKALRDPKAGERVISMHGSPLANHTEAVARSAPQAIIPLAGGKTMQFSVDDKQPLNDQEIDVTNDSVALQNIRLLQEKLSMLLKMPKNME